MATPSPGPGWYPDPLNPGKQAYWDGNGWGQPVGVSGDSDKSKKTAVAVGVCVLVGIGLVMSMQSVSLLTGSGPVWTGVGVVAAGTAVAFFLGAVGFHVEAIKAAFGEIPLTALRPSAIKTWVAQLRTSGASDHYTYTLHSRLSQILSDAVHDGLLGRNPCSRRTSPPRGKQKPYVASTEQVWALHDVMPEHLQAAVLLGAFAGLRISEACGLRVDDVDFTRGVVHPHQQYGGAPLKTAGSEAPIPIPRELTLMLASSVQRYRSEWMVTDGAGESCPPRAIERAVRTARAKVDGLPAGFSFHDLRHYLASLLIASGADIKTVQARLRHAAAATTLDTYGHLWPGADESTRAAVGAAIRTRIGTAADGLRGRIDLSMALRCRSGS